MALVLALHLTRYTSHVPAKPHLPALPALADFLRVAESLLIREELRERFEILLVDAGDDAGHDRILSLTALVVLERLDEIVGALSREDRVVVHHRLRAVGAVAGDARLRCRRRRADNLVTRCNRLALKVSGDIGTILIGQPRCLGV